MLSLEKRRSAHSKRVLAAIAALLTLLLVGMVACSTTSTSGLPPVTGILIRAETLTAGKGCGSEPSQLYKYVVVVYGFSGGAPQAFDRAVTSNVFDCYTDGAFISLTPQNDNPTFRLEVFAYNRAAYDAKSATLSAAGAVGRDDPTRLAGFGGELRNTAPTWTTQCFATQLTNVEALASCAPLGMGLSGLGGTVGPTTITLDTTSFRLPDGRVAACTNVVTDGGVEPSEAGDDGDASDAAVEEAGAADAGDAGAALGFSHVRVRTRVGAQIVADTIVPCPALYTQQVAGTPTTYDLDIGLLDSADDLIDPGALTTCTATGVPGGSSSAVCP